MATRARGGHVAVLALALAASAACRRAPAELPVVADASSTRTLAGGTIVGFTGRYGAHVWRGIPYAAPPVGAFRWRAPQLPTPWSDTRPALAPAPDRKSVV